MAGNPFRRSQILNPAAAVSSSAVSAPSYQNQNADGGDSSTDGTVRDYDSGNASPPPPAKTKKSVRIESPTSTSPHPAPYTGYESNLDRSYRENDAGHPGARSPAGFSDSFDSYASAEPHDSRGGGDSAHEAGEMIASKRRDSDMASPMHSVSGAPINPFAKTLATIEPQERDRVDPAHAGQQKGRAPTEKAGNTTPKANLDVEGFKRLLMTGIAGPSGTSQSPRSVAPAPNAVAPPPFESSSTDTSSISRQSIFDHGLQEPHVETPRTSYEMAPSDDDTLGLVTEVKKKEKKKPPPAPKHRHGKLVTSRAPQTVSFSDFEATEPVPAPVPQRTNSNLNKPLPPTPTITSPPSHIISQDISQDITELVESPPPETRSSDSLEQPNNPPTPQKKVPPPVPLARRQSQLRSSKGNRSRSSSNLTISSQHSISEFPVLSPGISSDAAPSPSYKVPPPPPPTRRHGNSLTSGTSPSATSSTTELPATARRSNVSSPSAPTSRRTTGLASSTSSPAPEESGLARTSSLSSNRNTPRSVSNESASMAPPPPPPRRRQSGRTSLDKERPSQYAGSSPGESRRTSSEYKRSSLDGKRRTSVASESSLKYEYAPAAESEHPLYSPQEVEEPKSLEATTVSTTNTSDILDDMEKFQREIDELRERYQKEIMKRLWMPSSGVGIV